MSWWSRLGRKPEDRSPSAHGHGARPLWDFHCHLLPAVDDGLRSLAETQAAIAGMRVVGYHGAVMTPHIYRGVYDNRPGGLREEFAALQASIGTEFPLYLAAEYFADERLLEDIAQDDVLFFTVGAHRVVLVEFSAMMPPPMGMDVLAQLRRNHYQPVLAHMERYRYVQSHDQVWLERFAHLGVWLQCDIGSLVGQYGPKPQHLAQKLLSRDLPTLWGTDLHRVEQLQRYIVPGLAVLAKHGVQINAVLDSLSSNSAPQ